MDSQFEQKGSTQPRTTRISCPTTEVRTKDSKGNEQCLGSGCQRGAHQIVDQSLYDLVAAERELQAISGFGANVSVNSPSGVIAHNLSNELKDLAGAAETEQDVLHMFDWLGVQIGWVLLCSRYTPLRGHSPRGIEDVRTSRDARQSLEDQETQCDEFRQLVDAQLQAERR